MSWWVDIGYVSYGRHKTGGRMIALLSLALATEPTLAHVHGWEDNSHFVVETRETSYGEIESEEVERIDPTLVYGDRYNLWGARHRTLIRQTHHDADSLPGPTNEAGWTQWLTTRTFTNDQPTRALGDGLTVSIRSKDEGEWTAGKWSYRGSEDETLVVGVQRSGGGWWPVLQEESFMGAWGYTYRSVHLYPSPDERWLAVYVATSGAVTMRGTTLGSSKWTVHQVRPLVSVLAPAGQSSHADAVIEQLSERGNGLLQTGTAQAARETTTVYFKPGFKSDAERMARQIPGDAVVEPMTWQGPQDVVVALGPPPAAD
jgi:hypothetical protein